MELDADLGFYIGDQVKQWQTGLDITPDLIASHGHTVFHEPAKGFTTQIGNGACIVARAGMDAITNFRNSDVALGVKALHLHRLQTGICFRVMMVISIWAGLPIFLFMIRVSGQPGMCVLVTRQWISWLTGSIRITTAMET